MGEALFFGGKDKNDAKNDNDDGQRIEQDVREALSSMGLPLSSEGARAALVKVGRWSSGSGDATKGGGGGGGNNNKRNPSSAAAIEPWPKEVLDEAKSLVEYEAARRAAMVRSCVASGATTARRPRKGSKSDRAAVVGTTTSRHDAISLC